MKNKNINLGQGLVELVFSIGVIVLVLTGVVALLTSSLHSTTAGFDRKKGAELGQKVMDQIIEKNRQDPASFWNFGSVFWQSNIGPTMSGSAIGYSGYIYSIGASQVAGPPGCRVPPDFDCVEVTVGVGWSAASNQNLNFSRFFSRKQDEKGIFFN